MNSATRVPCHSFILSFYLLDVKGIVFISYEGDIYFQRLQR